MSKPNITAQISGAPTLVVYGHSLNYVGASPGGGVAQRLGRMLGADVEMRAIGGSALAINGGFGVGFGAGGWDHVYRYTGTGASGSAANQNEGYGVPRRGHVLFWTGTNDMGENGALAGGVSTTTLAPFTNALRACLSRVQATNVYEDNDSTVTYPDGGWTAGVANGSMAPGVVNVGSNATIATCTTTNARVVITTQSFFKAGTVAVGLLANATGAGALFNVNVDGTNVGTVDTRNGQSSTGFPWWVPYVFRCTGLTAGVHTITVTPTNINTTAYFDCWWREDGTIPIGVPLQYRYPSQAFTMTTATGSTAVTGLSGLTAQQIADTTASGNKVISGPGLPVGTRISGISGTTATLSVAATTGTTAGAFTWFASNPAVDTDTLSTVITNVVAEFAANVFTIPTDDVIGRDPTKLSDRAVHMNDVGHGAMADRFHDYFRRHTPSRATQANGAASASFTSRWPNTTERNTIRPQIGSTIPLTVQASDSMDLQTADLFRINDGLGALLAGFSKRGGLKYPNIPSIDGRMNWGTGHVTWGGSTMIAASANIAHNLGHTFTGNTVSGSPNLGHTFTATTNATTAISGVSPAFVAADVGQTITGPGIPGGTTLVSQTGTAGVLSAAATTSTTATFVVVGQSGLSADDVGRNAAGSGLPLAGQILAVGSGWATLSVNASATANNVTLNVVPRIYLTSVGSSVFFYTTASLFSIDASVFGFVMYSHSVTSAPTTFAQTTTVPAAGTVGTSHWLALG